MTIRSFNLSLTAVAVVAALGAGCAQSTSPVAYESVRSPVGMNSDARSTQDNGSTNTTLHNRTAMNGSRGASDASDSSRMAAADNTTTPNMPNNGQSPVQSGTSSGTTSSTYNGSGSGTTSSTYNGSGSGTGSGMTSDTTAANSTANTTGGSRSSDSGSASPIRSNYGDNNRYVRAARADRN